MEQRTLDAIGVLIISTTAGGGVLGRLRSTRRKASTPRLRLGVLELGLGVLERSRWWAPRATSAQVPLVQVQVHLGYASVYLDLDSGYLSGVGQVHLPPLWYLY